MKCFPAMVIFFIITAMASWFGCDTQQKDLDGKSIPHVTQVKDSTNEQSGNWIPPRGMPDGMPVPSVEPTRYYHDQSEYKIANVEYQKRLLELGRRQPKTDNEIHIMMKRCRKTLDELGYQPNTVYS